jgi:hypothetical protein
MLKAFAKFSSKFFLQGQSRFMVMYCSGAIFLFFAFQKIKCSFLESLSTVCRHSAKVHHDKKGRTIIVHEFIV